MDRSNGDASELGICRGAPAGGHTRDGNRGDGVTGEPTGAPSAAASVGAGCVRNSIGWTSI